MNFENTKKLIEKYPKIFGLITDPGPEPRHCISLFMFEHSDGWYTLVDTLCAYIQSIIDHRNKDIERCIEINDLVAEYVYGNHEPLIEFAGKNLDTYIRRGIKEVSPAIPQVVATQVKEKYGGLRFYFSGGNDEIDAAVQFAEMLSERTCETCGAPGKIRGHGWYYTACDAHTKEEDLNEKVDN